MLYGLLNLSFWGYVIATLILTHITIISVTVYLHRHQAHRGLEIHPILSHFFRFWLWLTTGMVTKQWAAIHRKHHAKCETEEDPHSPVILGIKKVLFEGAELYRGARKQKETMERYGHGTPDDWIEHNVYTKHSDKGVFFMLAIDLILFGLPGITIWAVQMMWIPFFAAGVINGIGHFWGYRNFECPDAARNIIPWGILIGGEELHNNHHTYGTSAKLSVKWWEFDLGWAYIRLFQALRLAKVKRLPPKVVMVENKISVDIETVKSIINNRFQVLSQYSREVILPVLKAEKRKNRTKSLIQAKNLLIRHEAVMSAQAQEHLGALIQNYDTLNVVYEFRKKLQAIWTHTTASQRELLEALCDWCKQAEATGLEALSNFATYLRKYTAA